MVSYSHTSSILFVFVIGMGTESVSNNQATFQKRSREEGWFRTDPRGSTIRSVVIQNGVPLKLLRIVYFVLIII